MPLGGPFGVQLGSVWCHFGSKIETMGQECQKMMSRSDFLSDFSSILGVVLDDVLRMLGCLLGCVW